MRLTASTIRSFTLPHGKTDKTFWDDDLPGFGLRLRGGGSRVWLIQYAIHGKTRRMVLGSMATIEPGAARETAKDLLARVRLGEDPAREKHKARIRASETFGAMLPRYLARQRSRLKPRSYIENERHLLVAAKPLHALAVEAIDRRTIAIRLAEIAETSGPTAANRARASLSAFFSWLRREGLTEAANPVLDTNKAAEAGARERTLKDGELAKIWQVAGDNQYGTIVRLLLLTGARRDEIASLRWSEVDFEGALILLPPERVKSRRVHEIPLTAPALKILAAQPRRLQPDGSARDLVFGYGEGGFQLWGKSVLELDARIAARGVQLPHWTLHDFRRTLSTRMHETLGVQPHIVEAVLGHVSGHQGGVAGTYNKSAYRAEKRRALEVWAEHVLSVVEGRRRKVVPLRSA
jgi:integrase